MATSAATGISSTALYAPLEGVRVLDLCRLNPGAIATRKLADMGAEVVKVEEPGTGDYMRLIPPLVDGVGLLHRVHNRGKLSVTLDLNSSEGLAQLEQLGMKADVITQSFRPGKLEKGSLKRLGDLLTELRRRRPELIICAITGFGMTGEFAQLPAHGNSIDALSGTMSIVDREGSPGIGAMGSLGPKVGALNAAAAICAALFRAQRTGVGVAIDISCWDAAVDCRSTRVAHWMGGYGDQTDVNDLGPLHSLYETADEKLLLFASIEKKFWTNFCVAIDRPDLLDRWQGGGASVAAQDQDTELREELRQIFRARRRDEWVRLFSQYDVIGTPVMDINEIPQLGHFRDRQLAEENPTGLLPQIYDPIRWMDDGSRPGNGSAEAPILGEHQDLVFERWLRS
ncbi:MAG TPA: CoA transferase [Candidatus Acidoferrum sp.]|nr:CoA transferase [Candidatus Acidoferrum sp.]